MLVLGCGTGRVSRLLQTDRDVTGLDQSAPMLERARARSRPGDRTRWVQGDIRTFDLGLFGEIVVPNGTFCFLHTREDQLTCLQACARALPVGAPLVLDLPAPDFAYFGVPHTPERLGWQGQVEGRAARRTREVWRRPLEARIDLLDRYFLDDTLVATSLLPLQLCLPREIEWMCEAGGFWVDAIHGDYSGGPLRDGCPRIIVRACRC
ncbi:MAG: class I SAM-dependent methyltransferase [Pseudomonadota bacterium]|nr:class I SAM-dependent methyltransferase [Pseudomonadota bacterium]